MPSILRRVALLAAVALLLSVGAQRALDSAEHARAATGGPVILGGDDMDDHGSRSGSTAVQGWLYIQRAIENIGPNVTRSGNDGSIAALGSAAGSVATSSDAGASIDLAGANTGRTVVHYEGAAAINTFFADPASNTVNPAIIHLAGDQATNDFDATEEAAVTAHAADIAAFVSSGGGLFSHGTYYGRLTALLPGASAVPVSGGNSLYFTADGLTDLPGLTLADINAGPWHNRFDGDLGGLKILARDSVKKDSLNNDAPVIIGGSQVTFDPPTETPTATSTATATDTATPTPAATNTPIPTSTATATATATASSTATSTVTSTATNSATSTPTATNTPTSTPTVINTSTATSTSTSIATQTPQTIVRAATSTNTSTSVPSTETPVAVTTLPASPPASGLAADAFGQGRAGSIVSPNTGSGPGARSDDSLIWISAAALAIAGAGAVMLARRWRNA